MIAEINSVQSSGPTIVSSKRSRDEVIDIVSSKRTKANPKILDGKFFDIKTRDGDNVKATCQLCGTIRKGSVNGTGNFTKHFHDHHPEKVDEMNIYIKSKSSTVSSTMGLKQTKLNVSITLSKVIVERIVHLKVIF